MANKSRKTTAQSSPSQRSAISNGSRFFIEKIDGRSASARRFRDIFFEITTDLGGIEQLSEIQIQLVRRFASLSIAAENLEMAIAKGKNLDVPAYNQITSTQSRIATILGLERRMKVVPPIDSYLDQIGDKQ